MAHKAIASTYRHVEKVELVPHDRYLPDRWTGKIELCFHIPKEHPVIIGGGRMVLVENLPAQKPTSPVAVADIVRSSLRALPVLPGSSQKGAVRAIYEILSPSCQLAACRITHADSRPQLCPACALFGTAGVAGRVRFGEAMPEEGRWRLERPKVPTAWKPRKSKAKTLKVYDSQEARSQQRGRPPQLAKKTEKTWGVSGTFHSKIHLMNASDEEIGLLFGALGLGSESPMLRLGGKKFDGYGAVDIELTQARQIHPHPSILYADEIGIWSSALLQRAVLDRPERKQAWDLLHSTLRKGY